MVGIKHRNTRCSLSESDTYRKTAETTRITSLQWFIWGSNSISMVTREWNTLKWCWSRVFIRNCGVIWFNRQSDYRSALNWSSKFMICGLLIELTKFLKKKLWIWVWQVLWWRTQTSWLTRTISESFFDIKIDSVRFRYDWNFESQLYPIIVCVNS